MQVAAIMPGVVMRHEEVRKQASRVYQFQSIYGSESVLHQLIAGCYSHGDFTCSCGGVVHDCGYVRGSSDFQGDDSEFSTHSISDWRRFQ